jgi:hypothetical protein
MSAWGHKRTWLQGSGMSASPPITDLDHRRINVRYVPEADSSRPYRQSYGIAGMHRRRLSCSAAGRSDADFTSR